MAALLVFAMAASVMPLYDASAPAIETNTIDTDILINNVTASPATVAQGGTVNITCDVTANGTAAIQYVNLTVTDPNNNTQTYTMISNTTDANGNGTYWNATVYSIAGVYHFTINVTDANGNWNFTGDNTFTVNDTTAPTISNVAATPSSVVESKPVNITASVADNVGVNSVKLTVKRVTTVNNTTNYEVVVNNTAMTENNGTYYYEAAYGVGSYVFEIYADDAAGNSAVDNSSTNTFEVTADTSAPVISNVAANPTSVVQGGAVNITADVTDDGVGVDAVMVNITYPDGTYYNESMALYNGTYYYETTYDAIGTYTFFVWANDTNGNAISSAEDTFEVTDGTAPVIETPIVSVNVTRVTITVNVTDNYYNAANLTVTIYLTLDIGYGDEIIEDNTAMELVNATAGTFEYVSGALDFGDYNFTIYATDGANNDAVPVNGAFSIVDTEDPVISNVAVSPQNPTIWDDINLTFTATDNIGIDTVTVVVDGMTYYPTLSGGTYYLLIPVIEAKEYTYVITAMDVSGRTANYSGTFTVTEPQIIISSDTPTKATAGDKITIKVTLPSYPDLNVTLIYIINNDTSNAKMIPMTLVNGEYVAEISIPDNAESLTYGIMATTPGKMPITQSGTVEIEPAATGLDPMLLAGVGILILVIIIAAAMMMKKKGGAKPSEEPSEEESEEEFGEEEESEEALEEDEEL